MPPTYKNWPIEDFSGGLKTRFDARSVGPDKPGAKAESPSMENVDIIQGGAIITSTGYELVSSRGSGTGGVKNLQYYDKDGTTKELVITHDDDHLTTTAGSAADWTSIASSDYGTIADNVGSVVYKGSSSTRRVILGTDLAANTTREYDASTYANVTGTPPDGHILAHFMGRLFSAGDPANPTLLSYTNVDDEDDWAGGGTISFNDIITGLKVEGERLIVFWRDGTQGVFFSYDNSFNLSTALKETFVRDGGCYSPKTIAGSFNKTYYFGPQGVLTIGSSTDYANNNNLVDSLSWKIKPSLDDVNIAQISKATGVYFNRQYLLATPSKGLTFNDQVHIYNLDHKAWTYRSGLYVGDFEIFPDTNGIDELVFGSSAEPSLYKFNNSYTYNGAGYTRKWTSKIFNFGDSLSKKEVPYIELTGSMYENTEFQVIVSVDGLTKTFTIDAGSLITSLGGGYLGDSFLGDGFLGGEIESEFKRFYQRIELPASIREGHEFQVQFKNNGAGQPWKVDYFNWSYRYLPKSNLADNFYNNNLSPL